MDEDIKKFESSRNEFLLHMYDQMFNDINRHINMIWQPITVLVGAFALIAAGEKQILSPSIAVSLIIMLIGWLVANVYDSAYWYNRNLVIIANIERQFLKQTDLKEIHYYFGKHRSKQSIITILRIQWWLGLFIGGLTLIYHFLTEIKSVIPCLTTPATEFHWELILPYLTSVVIFYWVLVVRRHRVKSYVEFITNSPGKNIDTTGTEYGVGHPIDQDSEKK